MYQSVSPRKEVLLASSLIVLIIAFGSISTYHAEAADINPALYPKDSKPFGMSYGEWAARWQSWMISVPTPNNPTTDHTGKNCALGQSGPVWFLTGTTGGSAVRNCTIPSGKAIMFPIIASECDYASYPSVKKLEDLIACAKQDVNTVTTLDASIDGVTLKNLNTYRVTSPLFSLTIPPENIFGAPAGKTQGVIDGFFLIFQPIPSGNHQLRFSGINPGNPTTGTENYAVDVTYNLVIK